ncbi:MAG: GDP-L-fucose synthase [Halioglobus sp.]
MIRIFVAGHNGMVGSAIVRQLELESDVELITASRAQLDLTNQAAVAAFFAEQNIDEVYLCAAKVGGIHANNTYPADFIYTNLMLECNVIQQAYAHGVHKLLFLGSSCIYPRLAEQPMREEALLTGALEPTSEPYAVAKIAGIKLCESYNRQHGTDYRSVMPTNLYGPGDNFHPENSHVIPALMRRFHEAAQARDDTLTVLGSGRPMREFLHVDDMASASIHVMNLSLDEYQVVTEPRCSHINVGTGTEVTIADLATTMADVTGYSGTIEFDSSKPDGAPRKLMNSAKLRSLGWAPNYLLKQGLLHSYEWFVAHQESFRA